MYSMLFANRGLIAGIAMFLMLAGFGFGPYVGAKIGNKKLGVATVIMFVFGGMFFGIGINPALGAPQGSPGMVYCGFLLLLVGFLILISALLSHKIKALNSEAGKNNLGRTILVVALVVTVLGIGIAIASSPSSSNSNGRNSGNDQIPGTNYTQDDINKAIGDNFYQGSDGKYYPKP